MRTFADEIQKVSLSTKHEHILSLNKDIAVATKFIISDELTTHIAASALQYSPHRLLKILNELALPSNSVWIEFDSIKKVEAAFAALNKQVVDKDLIPKRMAFLITKAENGIAWKFYNYLPSYTNILTNMNLPFLFDSPFQGVIWNEPLAADIEGMADFVWLIEILYGIRNADPNLSHDKLNELIYRTGIFYNDKFFSNNISIKEKSEVTVESIHENAGVLRFMLVCLEHCHDAKTVIVPFEGEKQKTFIKGKIIRRHQLNQLVTLRPLETKYVLEYEKEDRPEPDFDRDIQHKRYHKVLSHWRIVNSFPGNMTCDHNFVELTPNRKSCLYCGQQRTRVKSHGRGNRDLGVVNKVYKVVA